VPVRSVFEKFVTLGTSTFYMEAQYSLPVRGIRSAYWSPDGSTLLLLSGTSTQRNLSGGEYPIGQVLLQFVNPGAGKQEPKLSAGRLSFDYVAGGLEDPDPMNFIDEDPKFLSPSAVVFEQKVSPEVENVTGGAARGIPFESSFTARVITLFDANRGVIVKLPLGIEDKMFKVPDSNRPGYSRAFVYLANSKNSNTPFFQEITPQGYGKEIPLPEGTVAVGVDKFGNIRCTVPVDNSPESELVPRIFSPNEGRFVNAPDSKSADSPIPALPFSLTKESGGRFFITDGVSPSAEFPSHSIPLGTGALGLLSPGVNQIKTGINTLIVDRDGNGKLIKLTPSSLEIAQRSILNDVNERKAQALSSAIEKLENQATAFSNMTDADLKAAIQGQIDPNDLRDLPKGYQDPFDWGSSQVKFNRKQDGGSQSLSITVTFSDGRRIVIGAGGVSFKPREN
jgi:hypothetical protein